MQNNDNNINNKNKMNDSIKSPHQVDNRTCENKMMDMIIKKENNSNDDNDAVVCNNQLECTNGGCQNEVVVIIEEQQHNNEENMNDHQINIPQQTNYNNNNSKRQRSCRKRCTPQEAKKGLDIGIQFEHQQQDMKKKKEKEKKEKNDNEKQEKYKDCERALQTCCDNHNEDDKKEVIITPTNTTTLENSASDNCSTLSLSKNSVWENMYINLVEYITQRRFHDMEYNNMDYSKQEKNCNNIAWIWDGNVPQKYMTNNGIRLGQWINTQRTAKTKGILNSEHEERLTKLGLKWKRYRAKNQDNSNSCFHTERTMEEQQVPPTVRLQSQKEIIDNDDDNDDNVLATSNRTIQRSRKKLCTPQEKANEPSSIEEVEVQYVTATQEKKTLEFVITELSINSDWDKMYKTLVECSNSRCFRDIEYMCYSKEEGGWTWNGNFPIRYVTNDGIRLGKWINTQRIAKRNGTLHPEHEELLTHLGLKWKCHHTTNMNTTNYSHSQQNQMQRNYDNNEANIITNNITKRSRAECDNEHSIQEMEEDCQLIKKNSKDISYDMIQDSNTSNNKSVSEQFIEKKQKRKRNDDQQKFNRMQKRFNKMKH